MKSIISFLFVALIFQIKAQDIGNIYGNVIDKYTREPLIGASVIIENTQTGTITDENGKYKFETETRALNLVCTYVGYNSQIKYNIVLTSGNAQNIDFELELSLTELNEVVVKTNRVNSARATDVITPLSVQTLTIEEIRSNPGGNFDVSKVIQALPGVSSSTGSGGFRNDIILRGGSPNENVYYLDGIEIPVLNHFSTQGSAGGPVGIINTTFTKDIKLSTSAFSPMFDNALSGIFEINQKEGNPERLQGNIRLSATELAASVDGPISSKSSFLLSARRSYLQYLFELIDLPIRPNYWDFQTKYTHQIGPKTKLNIIGIGAIDDFKFATPENTDAENIYIVRSSPIINQWNYTAGVSINHLLKDGYIFGSLSRNHFNNNIKKYENNENPIDGKESLKSDSKEIENKLRISIHKSKAGFSYSYGLSVQQVNYNNDFSTLIRNEIRDELGNVLQPEVKYDFRTNIDFIKYGLFAQVAKNFNNKFSISGGLRSDMNTFTNNGSNGLNTLSPRIAGSIAINEKLKFNAAWGVYYKIPIYTVLGYKNGTENLINKNNEYIRSKHYSTGFEFLPKSSLRFTIEGFYKNYDQYPVSIFEGISLANQGGDFGAIGNEAVTSIGEGETYGVEVFAQQKLVNFFFYTLSYTFYHSRFSGSSNELISSAWDNRHILSAIIGIKLGRQWEIGIKYRYAGGSPFTPYDLEASQRNYLTLGQGILDYAQLNSQKLKPFSQVDLRVDKKWNYKKWTLDLFFDIQNITATEAESYPNYTFKRNEGNTGFASTDGNELKQDGSNAIPLILENLSGIPTPTLGFIIEF